MIKLARGKAIYLYVIIWRKNEKIDCWGGRSGAADRRSQRFHTGLEDRRLGRQFLSIC